jgi:sterol desaturase/sphingolipid hydroxylase (fatty acid hydroxylase superfamily)
VDSVGQFIAVLHLREIAASIAAGLTSLISLATGPEFANRLAAAVQLDMLARASVYTLVLIGGLFAMVSVLERATGARPVAYGGRNFRQDVLYALFYQGGFYNVLLWSALANAMQDRLAFLKFEILAGLPGPVHWVLYWLCVDFLTYWWHRWLHTSRFLWAIHSVHHTQREMSFISSYRMHPLEQLMQNIIMVVPLLVMGIPTFRWLPLVALMAVLEGVQHSALNWGYGRGYTLLVSPRFHALHHSDDPRHFNRNFSKILSVWDFAFGTGVRADARPERLGVEGLPVPRTMVGQLLAPFRIMGSWFGRRGTAAVGS